MKPVLGVAEVGRIRVTDQRSRVSRRTRGEEALGPIESAYREQNGVPARSPDLLPVRCSPRLHFLSLSLSLSLTLPPFFSSFSFCYSVSRHSPLDSPLLFFPLRFFFVPLASLDPTMRLFFSLFSPACSKAFFATGFRVVEL